MKDKARKFRNSFGSYNCGKLPKGCRQCMEGKKLVIFLTGVCPENCYYCTISSERRARDSVFANERPVRSAKDLLVEAREMRAMGAGITGGEPLARLDRAVKYIRLLKKEFGKAFHIHLYTYGKLVNDKVIKRLEKAGLDEIRFHLLDGRFDRILPALDSKMQVTVEVPVIPAKKNEKELYSLVDFMKENGVRFLNLNEFEFAEAAYDKMLKKGFRPIHPLTYAVKGSKELALKLLDYARPEINAHFCPVQIKTGLQLQERLKRRAKTIRKPFEKVDENGFLEKVVVEGLTAKQVKAVLKKYGKKVFFNKAKKRVETGRILAGKIYSEFGGKAFWLTEYPSFDSWDFEKQPLS